MPGNVDLEDELTTLSLVTIVIAGVNFIWGMFIFPWGLFAYASGIIDILLFFLSLKARSLYLMRNYHYARRIVYYCTILGFIFGLVITGIIAYRVYREIDDIILRRHLVRGKGSIIYAPPQFPKS